MDITLPIIQLKDENKTLFIEQLAGQKNLLMLKESFSPDKCFCKLTQKRCENFCYAIYEYFSYLFLKVLDKLNNLHKIGFAHSDIKPKNIVIGYDNQPYLIDFGSSVSLSQFDDYLQEYTFLYNLKKYFQETVIDGKKQHVVNFKFNEKEVKICDRSQLALSWLYLKCRTLQEQQLFKQKEFNQLLKIIHQDYKRNKLIGLFSRILNEADSSIEVYTELAYIERPFLNLINDNIKQNSIIPLNYSKIQKIPIHYNLYFDYNFFEDIVSYQKDIIYKNYVFCVQRINENSFPIVCFLNDQVNNINLDPNSIEIKPVYVDTLNKNDLKKEYEVLSKKYNLNKYFDKFSKYRFGENRQQDQNFLSHLKITQSKEFEINYFNIQIEDFLNLMKSLKESQHRQSIKIYINFENCSLKILKQINQILEEKNYKEQIQLIDVYGSIDLQQIKLIFRCRLVRLVDIKEKNQQHNFNEILVNIIETGLFLDRIKIQSKLIIFKRQQEMRYQDLQNESFDQKTKLKNKIEKIKQMISKLKFHIKYLGFKQRLFLLKNEEDKQEYRSILSQHEIITENKKYYVINYQDSKIQESLFNYFELAQDIYLIHFKYNQVISMLQLQEIIPQLKSFISLTHSQFLKLEITFYNFVFKNLDFCNFINDVQQQYQNVWLQINLIDCLYHKKVYDQLKALKGIQVVQEYYQNIENLQLETYQIKIQFNETVFSNSYKILINFQQIMTDSEQKTNNQNLDCQNQNQDDKEEDSNQVINNQIQNKKIREEDENKIINIFNEQVDLTSDKINNFSIKTEQYDFTFHFQKEPKQINQQTSVQSLKKIINDLFNGINYYQMRTNIDDKAEIIYEQDYISFGLYGKQINIELVKQIVRLGFLTVSQNNFMFNLLFCTNKMQVLPFYSVQVFFEDQIQFKFNYDLKTFNYENNEEQQDEYYDEYQDEYNEDYNNEQDQDKAYISQMCQQITHECLCIFEELIIKGEKGFRFEFYGLNMSDNQIFENQFEYIEKHFKGLFRTYQFTNCNLNDNTLQFIQDRLKEYKHESLSFNFQDKQITLAGLLHFIENLLLIDSEIGFIIHISYINDERTLKFIKEYFQKYTKIFERNERYLVIMLFPKDPKQFFEFIFNVKFNLEQSQLIQRKENQVLKIQEMYGKASIEQSLNYPIIDQKFYCYGDQ